MDPGKTPYGAFDFIAVLTALKDYQIAGRDAHYCAIRRRVPEHSSAEFDERSLNQKRQWCMREGKVAIGKVAERDAVRAVKDVAQIPKHAQS